MTDIENTVINSLTFYEKLNDSQKRAIADNISVKRLNQGYNVHSSSEECTGLIIDALQNAMTGMQGSGMGFVLPLLLVGLTALIVILSGSGTALFFAMVPLMIPLAAAAGINVLAVTIPMSLAGNLLRELSPVAGVIMIVSGTVKKSPFEIIRRTSVPMIVGVVVMFVLSMAIFLPMGTA